MATDFWSWDTVLNALPTVVTSLFGASQASKANTQAANIAANTATTNTQILREAADRATGIVTPLLNTGTSMAEPATAYMRNVMARPPEQLTPQQQITLNDTQMQAQRGISPGLRGSARANSAILNDIYNRGQAAMIQANQGRSDAAAKQLQEQGLATARTAAPAVANIATGNASNIAAENTSAGSAAANAATNTAASNNSALSAISSYFANLERDATRPSAYAGYKAGLG